MSGSNCRREKGEATLKNLWRAGPHRVGYLSVVPGGPFDLFVCPSVDLAVLGQDVLLPLHLAAHVDGVSCEQEGADQPHMTSVTGHVCEDSLGHQGLKRRTNSPKRTFWPSSSALRA